MAPGAAVVKPPMFDPVTVPVVVPPVEVVTVEVGALILLLMAVLGFAALLLMTAPPVV